MSNLNLTFGADPEVFATYSKKDKDMVLPPAWFREYPKVEYMVDPKKPTHPIFIQTPEYIVHEDGVAFELGVMPSNNWEELYDRIQMAYMDLEKNILSEHVPHCDGKVHIVPTVSYEVNRWLNESDEFQQCLIFGCDPDEDAFNMRAKKRVKDVRKHPYRYGGGHIHISGAHKIEEEPILAVQVLACTLGQAAIAYSDMKELEHLRTYLYGRPGKFRFQTYSDGTHGIEYRTPSNRWTGNKDLARKVFEWAEIGMHIFNSDLAFKVVDELSEDAAQNIIDTNQEGAMQILSRIEEMI